ncbi:MAG: NfeD family protein [Treponema sp.]|nr:NfeD family protein [Treponema sp.]
MIIFSNLLPWLWLGVLVICCVIEALTLGLTTIWGAIAAFPLIFIARTSLPLKWQLLIFAVLVLVLVLFTRPFVVKKLKIGKDKTNVNTMVGEEVLITKTITKFEKGEAKAKNGVIWSVTTADGNEVKEGSVAKVISVDGNTLTVAE